MTTLASWVGVDSRAPASLYIVADSRISWNGTGARWDYGRKTFACHTSPEIFGYVGDVPYPSQTIGQLTELIDRGAIALNDTSPEGRLEWIAKSLTASCSTYPPSVPRGDFSVLYAGRQGEGMTCTFYSYLLDFKQGALAKQVSLPIPTVSGPLTSFDTKERVAFGSGRDGFKNCWERWSRSDVKGTSRAVYSAFADHVKSNADPNTGGAPQLVGLYRVEPAKSFGVIWDERRFLGGMEVFNVNDEQRLTWHNDLFELCDPATLTRAPGAQPQPRPPQLP